jgi:hypothetical protein
MPTCKYNFETNVLKASRSQEFKIAIREWVYICETTRDTCDVQCICENRTLKHILYYYNIYTKKFIGCGGKCADKFNDANPKKCSIKLQNIFNEILMRCKYESISNIDLYCTTMQEQVVEYFKTKSEEYEKYSNFNKLEELSTDIKEIIDEYQMDILKPIYYDIIDKLDKERERNRLERERSERERSERDRVERERYASEREKRKIQDRDEEERKKREKSNSRWEKRENADGTMYWYDSIRHISRYTTPISR